MSMEEVKEGIYRYEPMKGMYGYYMEMDSNGQVVRIAKYDKLRIEKNGKCFELENGKLSRLCVYENGEMKRVIQGWELCHMILSGRIDSRFMDFLDDSFFVCDFSTGDTGGLFQLNGKYCSVEWSEGLSQSVMVDMDSKEMIVYRNDERIDTQYSVEVIDLDATGRRWEGEVKDKKPFGYGVIYDEEGRKEYEGFMKDGMRVCYGIEYYSDIGQVKYKGCYNSDNRFGKGVLNNRNGEVEYDGPWKDDKPYSFSLDGTTIDNHVELLDIPSDSFNELESFVLPSFIHSLKRIVIGDYCFRSVHLFELDGLSELESIEIRTQSITYCKKDDWNSSDDERTDSVCRIVNCSQLKSIQIDDYSFKYYHSFELDNLPSLQSIDIGRDCFFYSSSFSLIGLTD